VTGAAPSRIYLRSPVDRDPRPERAGIGPASSPRLRQGSARIHSLAERGIRLVSGLDAGIAPHKPYDVLPSTIADMAESTGTAGAPSGSAYRGAVACDIADRKGQLMPGFDGGILAVDSYP